MTKITSVKPNSDGISPEVTKTKTAGKKFASTSKADAPTAGRSSIPTEPVMCTYCKGTHPLWPCPTFRAGTPTHNAKVIADNTFYLKCLNGQYFFWQFPKLRKCTAEGCSSSHNVLFHSILRVFPHLPLRSNLTNTSNIPVKKESGENSSVVYQSDVKRLLETSEVSMQSPIRIENVLTLCNFAYRHSWICEKLAWK